MKHTQHNRGFALIEMIIYIALFGIMMGGVIVTVYQLSESSKKTQAQAGVQDEINFVAKKINWTLTGITEVVAPSSGTSNALTVMKDGQTFSIRRNAINQTIEMCTTNTCTADSDFLPISTVNVKVESLSFTYDPTTKVISSTFIVNGIPATVTKYLKI